MQTPPRGDTVACDNDESAELAVGNADLSLAYVGCRKFSSLASGLQCTQFAVHFH